MVVRRTVGGKQAGYRKDTQSYVRIPSGFRAEDRPARPVESGMDPQLKSDAAEFVCREILDLEDPVLPGARAIYESTLDKDERIPWEWLARTPEPRRQWQPGQRRSHLVVATPKDEPNRAVGFGYGAFLPGYGGYVCYLGVEPASRGHGLGDLLFQFLFRLIDSAARTSA